jgi:hypothetical protein
MKKLREPQAFLNYICQLVQNKGMAYNYTTSTSILYSYFAACSDV